MLALLVTLALLPQGTNQARLHPDDALVMVEVPDVTKMVDAYQRAPMVAMLHDAEVRKAFYGAFEDTEIDFDELLAEALTGIGMPEEFAEAPLEGIRHYLDGIGAASFSLSLDRVGLEEFGPRAARLGIIGTQLETIASAIEDYVGETEEASTLPKDLAALGLETEAVLDPWKHPYEYTVKEDGTYTLRSLGADGKPGGTGDAADVTAADVERTAEGFIGLLGFQTVIEFKSQAAQDEMRSILANLIARSGLTPARTGPFQMSGVQADLQSWKGPDGELGDVELWLMRAQNMLVLGAGRSTPEAFAARLADPRVQTAAGEFYAGLIKELGAPAGATIVQGSLRLADYASAFKKFAEASGESADQEVMDMLDSMLPNASVRIQLVGERFVTEAATKYLEPKGLISQALGLAPLPKSLLGAVPPEAIGVYASSLDGALLWTTLKDSFAKNPEDSAAAQEQIAEMEARHHFSVEKDVFGSLGNGMVAYMLPLKGLPSITASFAVVVDLKDPAAMQRGIEGMLAMIADEGSGVTTRSKPYQGVPLWTFGFEDEEGGGMNPMLAASFSPSISIVKNRLLFTFNQLQMKREIKRATGEAQAAHSIATEGHGPPEDATTFGYMDWATLLNGVYEGGRSAAGFFGGDLPVDVAKLPAPGVFTHFYKPTVFFSRTIPQGVYYRNESSFGPEVWAGLVGAGLLVGVATSSDAVMIEDESSGDEGDGMEGEESETPSEAPANGALRERTKAEMEHLETFLAVYRVETGAFPASLDVLLTPTKNYPKGFVGKDALPTDGWGRAFKYAQKEAGKSYRIWSTGPDGIDQDGGGDDIVD